MTLEWWHWAVLGFALIIAELLVPAFVLVWFGVGALVVAGLVWAAPSVSLAAQILTLTVVSSALIALWFRVFKPGMHKTRLGMADADITGQIGLLVEEVAPYKRGKVRFQRPLLGADVWECIADEAIEIGARVKVLSVEGSFVKVGRA
jgi:membrane protein implicated in regulation of membrane protease activity